jgi:hypothetical protein
MSQRVTEIKEDHIITDDLAFSAYLKMKGHCLIKSDRNASKTYFTFEVDRNADELKVEFINSKFLQFHNELRNLKKMISSR